MRRTHATVAATAISCTLKGLAGNLSSCFMGSFTFMAWNVLCLNLLSYFRELRHQLFGGYRRRHSHSRSRSRSRSPNRHRSHEEYAYGGRGFGRRYDDRERYYGSRSRRHRSISPGHRRGGSRSPEGRRKRSPIREGSEERRAKIALWNKEREQQQESANKVNADGGNNDKGSGVNVEMKNGNQYHAYQQQPSLQQGVHGY